MVCIGCHLTPSEVIYGNRRSFFQSSTVPESKTSLRFLHISPSENLFPRQMTGGVSCSLWKGGITMISEEEKLAVVKMFCAYCRRTLRNARTDIIRKQAREARWETVFSDMHESELNRLASPDDLISEEVVFEVVGREVVVMDTVLAGAIHGLSKGDQAIVLLYYFAEWTDRRIAEELGCPRSTVQFRRSKALLALRARLEEVMGDDEL